MPKFALALIVALLVLVGIGAARADSTYIPAIRGGARVTPTDTPDVFGTSTNTPTSTPTATTEGDTPTPTNTPTSTATGTSTSTPTSTATATATEVTSGPCPCEADTLNCSNFDTETEAQACMDWCVSQGAGDIHNLDGNANGTACESLPGGFRILK